MLYLSVRTRAKYVELAMTGPVQPIVEIRERGPYQVGPRGNDVVYD